MSYQRKRLTFFVVMDSLIVLCAIYFSFIILDSSWEFLKYGSLVFTAVVLLISHHVFAGLYNLYNKAWSYASVNELLAIAKAVTFTIFTTMVVQAIVLGDIYFRALAITWMIHILLIGGSRFSWRMVRDKYIKPKKDVKRALIVGAGAAGTMLTRQLLRNPEAGIEPVAFVDDDIKKYMLQIHGIPVAGTAKDIEEVAERYNVKQIIIAIPSLSRAEVQSIYKQCAKTNAKTVIMPVIEDVLVGKVSVSQFRDVEIEDLLGREPIELDTESIKKKLTGKTVLVTGAGGSIGSEICRQVCQFQPKKILLLGHGENSIYGIHMELLNKYKDEIEILPIIADVQDRKRIFEVMETHRPHVVYHAAAHKHVPMMEYNPKEAVKNNVFGTRNVAEAADMVGVGVFVLVSTDKAVNPTNVMGSTKRIAEMIVQQMDKKSETRFVAVRFGNVLGSRGSVIPLFKKQIKEGGPVTVTHPEMTRYFMTIPEASRLVMQAGALARGGEIFVLDMGEPVKIVDLAKNLIRLSGYEVDEIGIKFTGIRPGEKMYEELLNENEVHSTEIFPKIFIGKTTLQPIEEIEYLLDNLPVMSEKELQEYVLGLANRKYIEEKRKLEAAAK